MIRIAFTLIGGKNWTGGQNYLLNLLRTLSADFSHRVTPVVFVARESADDTTPLFDQVESVEVVKTRLLDHRRRRYSLAQSLLWGRDVAMRELFEQQQIDVVFEAAQFFGWRLGLPAIGWIPDFQHLFLPAMFTTAARWKRELGFRAQLFGGRTIMLSSEDARRACLAHYPASEANTRTVHFAVPAAAEITYAEAREIADQYHLPELFFYLPNQLWKHKNHELVIDALSILRQRQKPVFIAASGGLEDPRNPNVFADLKEKVARLGVEDNIRFLGLIPYAHVTALMRASCGFLNPSLFEGWSTTVEEARAAGVPMLLSDLDVHREQMQEQAVYFDRHSAESLADALAGFQPLDESQRQERIGKAVIDAAKRVRQFGENFTQLAESCVRPANRA